MNEQPLSLEVHRPLLREHLPLNPTQRPKLMIHLAPRVRGIRAKVRRPILATDKRGRLLREGQIHDGLGVDGRLDVVALAVLGDLHRDLVVGEVVAVGRELEVLEVVGAPEVFFRRVEVGDFGVELCGLLDTPAGLLVWLFFRWMICGCCVHDIAVDHLCQTEQTLIAEHVERLGLDAC